MLRKILTWGAIIFIAYYVISQPASAGHAAHGLLGDLKVAGNSLATFANNLGS